MNIPHALKENPSLDQWVKFNVDGTVTVRTGKAELGQGIKTAVTMIAADELYLDPTFIRVDTADTLISPNEFLTAGSMSVEMSGAALRQAAAQVRQIMLTRAAAKFDSTVDRLEMIEGFVRVKGSNLASSYFELSCEGEFGEAVKNPVTEKERALYRWVGKTISRVDLKDKLMGRAAYVQDMNLPGMVHARVVRPPGPNHRLLSLDEEKLGPLIGDTRLVRLGSFLAAVAPLEIDAIKARAKIEAAAHWQQTQPLETVLNFNDHLKANETRAFPVIDGTAVEDVVPPYSASPNMVREVSATYSKPYTMHGSIGPSTAMALYQDDGLRVWCHSQGVELLKLTLAAVLKISADKIRVSHVEGAGCYGHNGADDAALDAALVAKEMEGHPVLLKWTREDEHRWEPFGPAMMIEMRGGLDDQGRLTQWSHDVWSYSHSGRPFPDKETSGLLAAWHLEPPWKPPKRKSALVYHVGAHRNADPLYTLPNKRVVKHFVESSPLRTSSLRSLGAFGNIFAIESFMDELAHVGEVDPAVFRLDYLENKRAKAVIEKVVEMANQAPSYANSGKDKIGRGLAFAQYKNQQAYVALITELTVNEDSADIKLRNVWIAADVGLAIDPDGVISQLEGGYIQGASWTLKEQVTYDETGVTSVDWDSYPILTFSEVPLIETELIGDSENKPLGAGEASQGPTSASIANAVYDAVGLRARSLPITALSLKELATTVDVT